MFESELNSFLNKFHQLRKSGATAHLDVDTYAGQAWVGLRVMLDSIQHPPAPSQRHRSPSYYRRQERRRAARQSSDESDQVVAENAATEDNEGIGSSTTEKNAEVASKVENDFECEICDFRSNRRTGLKVHMSRKHATIEQLDGNMTMPIEDHLDEEFEYYLQTGYMRNPSLKGPRGHRLPQFIESEIRKCKPELTFDERVEEFRLMRKNQEKRTDFE